MKNGIGIKQMCIFAMAGALMFASTLALKVIPNVHLLALFIIVFTDIYRVKALIPIYIYVLLEGIYQGFSPWWVPYLYMWTILFAFAMLVPRGTENKKKMIIYPILGFVHGILFGFFWAPYQMIIFGLTLKGTFAWWLSGLPFDVIHGVSNAVLCCLCVPLIKIVKKLDAGK